MSTLHIQLLGDFRLVYHDEPVTTLHQARAQSLLAYLLLYRDAPQSRQQLAFLFWPETSDAQARTNLRRELHQLRHSLPDADCYLQITARTVQWLANVSCKLDVADFEDRLEQANQAVQAGRQAEVRTALEGALDLYRGRLLPTCYDDWILPTRERLERRFERGLEQLILLLEEQRDYPTAIRYAQQMLHHDALHEPTYRHLMRLYAFNGDRASALRVYHTCASILQRELEVAPTQETQEAYARLLNLDAPQELPAPTAAVVRTAARLVGRQPEWQQLRTAWRKAVQGQAHFVLVAGEAGIGKTRLAEELFESLSQQGIVTARSRSYAAEGARAYAPVIEWLRAAPLRATLDKLEDVWLTEVARLLPELLVERPALPRPEPLSERWQRQRLFEALARALAGDGQPRLLLIDDLQWCDPETLEWLRYWLHYDLAARLLLVGTMRAEEVDRDHPLLALVRELRNSQQLTEIELGPLDADDTTALAAQVAGQELAPVLMAHLYQETEGNPLFVVETVRAGMGEQRFERGERFATHNLRSPISSLQSLPPKVQAVIQSRLAQLSSSARELASLAATIGRSFTFDVLARASNSSEETLVRGLDELWRRGIVREHGGNAYDFSHDHIREAAYADISPAHQRLFHRRVAPALVAVYAANLDAVSGQVAVHYEQAGLPEQAIQYYQQAAAVSKRILAYGEATSHLKRGLAVLTALPVTAEHQQQELALLIALGPVLSSTKGYASQEVGEVYARAYELCQLVGDSLQTFVVQQELRILSMYRGECMVARQLAVANLTLAQELDDPELLQHAHKGMGVALHVLGELTLSHTHFEEVLCSPVVHNRFDHLFLDDAFQASLRTSVLPLWLLGYPDQARTRMQETLALSQNDRQSIRYVMHLAFAARLHYFLREQALVQQWSEAIIALCTKQGFSIYLAVGILFRGWAQALQGEWTNGIAQLRQGLAAQKAIGNRIFLPYDLAMLGEAHQAAGQHSEGLAVIHEALAVVEQTGECSMQAELFRLQGELLLAQGAAAPAVESCYHQAIEIARHQRAKSWELRATVSLARLWQKQDRQAEARQRLAEIYGWFSEGFDTPDLQAAQALLDALPAHS